MDVVQCQGHLYSFSPGRVNLTSMALVSKYLMVEVNTFTNNLIGSSSSSSSSSIASSKYNLVEYANGSRVSKCAQHLFRHFN